MTLCLCPVNLRMVGFLIAGNVYYIQHNIIINPLANVKQWLLYLILCVSVCCHTSFHLLTQRYRRGNFVIISEIPLGYNSPQEHSFAAVCIPFVMCVT